MYLNKRTAGQENLPDQTNRAYPSVYPRKEKKLPYLPVYNAHFFFHKNKHQNRGAYYTRILLFVKHVLICIR